MSNEIYKIWCVNRINGIGFFLKKKFREQKDALEVAEKCRQTGWYSKVEVINLNQQKPKLDRDLYNKKVVALVQECTVALFGLADKYGFSTIDLSSFDIESVEARFDDDDGNVGFEPIRKIHFERDKDEAVILIESDNFKAYIDENYGDYFDVAQTLPRLYAAVVDCINLGL